MYKFISSAFLVFLLFACSAPSSSPKKSKSRGYLKESISQTELENRGNYKRYSYICHNFDTDRTSYLVSYFPLWRESRLQENFGFYFQLDNGKAEPFDHIISTALNVRGSRFKVIYRSYNPIKNAYVELIAQQNISRYYRIQNMEHKLWLECKEE